jgi:hypothetical protein
LLYSKKPILHDSHKATESLTIYCSYITEYLISVVHRQTDISVRGAALEAA